MDDSLFSLEGKSALITGGNGGLGRAIALGFRSFGAMVAVTGRNAAKNESMRQELGEAGAVFELDVRDENAVQQTVARAENRFGRVDILVNSAGTTRGGSVVDLARDHWDEVLGTHLTGSFLCAKYAARSMIARGTGGKIINIGSIYSLFGPPEFSDYATAKAGILGLTRALAAELAPHNIQANAILPGWFPTEMTGFGPVTPLHEEMRRRTPAQRWGQPQELVGAAVLLASRASSFITGTQIVVDGGFAISDRPIQS
ncbi:MAG TPA: SDR family oxidoreductase [Chloroflexota bacterium]|nr:SDR family oxidoreductase [Chloroflexota bacterium]